MEVQDKELLKKLLGVADDLRKEKDQIIDRAVANITDETKRSLMRETLSEALNQMMNVMAAVTHTFKIPQEELVSRMQTITKELFPATIAYVREAARVNEEHKGVSAGSNSQGPVQ